MYQDNTIVIRLALVSFVVFFLTLLSLSDQCKAMPNFTKSTIIKDVDYKLASKLPQQLAILSPSDLCILDNGDIIFKDQTSYLRRYFASNQTIDFIFGKGSSDVEGVVSTMAKGSVQYLTKNNNGECVYAESNRIRVISNINATVTTIAGSVLASLPVVDGVLAKTAYLQSVTCVAFDEFGNFFTCETFRIRKVNITTGIINFFGGTGTGATGTTPPVNGAIAISTKIKPLTSILARNGTVYFTCSNSIMKIQNGNFSVVSGGWSSSCTYDKYFNGLATNACLSSPKLVDIIGDEIYFRESGFLRKIRKDGRIELVFGLGTEALDLTRSDQILQNITLNTSPLPSLKGIQIIPNNNSLEYYISTTSNILHVNNDSTFKVLMGIRLVNDESFSAYDYGIQFPLSLTPIKAYRNGDTIVFSSDGVTMYRISHRSGIVTKLVTLDIVVTSIVVDRSTNEDLYLVSTVDGFSSIRKFNIYSKSVNLIAGNSTVNGYQFDGQSSLDTSIENSDSIKYFNGSLYYSTNLPNYIFAIDLSSLTVRKIMGVGYTEGSSLSGMGSDASCVSFFSLDRIITHPKSGNLIFRTFHFIATIDNHNMVEPLIGNGYTGGTTSSEPLRVDPGVQDPMTFNPINKLYFATRFGNLILEYNSTFVRKIFTGTNPVRGIACRPSTGDLIITFEKKGLNLLTASAISTNTILTTSVQIGSDTSSTVFDQCFINDNTLIYIIESGIKTMSMSNYAQNILTSTTVRDTSILLCTQNNGTFFVNGSSTISKINTVTGVLTPFITVPFVVVGMTLQNGSLIVSGKTEGIFKIVGGSLIQIAGQGKRRPIATQPVSYNGWTITKNGDIYFPQTLKNSPLKKAIISEGVVVDVIGNGTIDNPSRFSLPPVGASFSQATNDGSFLMIYDPPVWYDSTQDKIFSTSYINPSNVFFTKDDDVLFLGTNGINGYFVESERDKYGYCLQNFTCFGVFYNENISCSGNGDCTKLDYCECNENYFSSDCSVTSCFGVWSNDSIACNGNGKCSSFDTCECDDGYYGTNCSMFKCFGVNFDNSSVCSGNGQCVSKDICNCNFGTNDLMCTSNENTNGTSNTTISNNGTSNTTIANNGTSNCTTTNNCTNSSNSTFSNSTMNENGTNFNSSSFGNSSDFSNSSQSNDTSVDNSTSSTNETINGMNTTSNLTLNSNTSLSSNETIQNTTLNNSTAINNSSRYNDTSQNNTLTNSTIFNTNNTSNFTTNSTISTNNTLQNTTESIYNTNNFTLQNTTESTNNETISNSTISNHTDTTNTTFMNGTMQNNSTNLVNYTNISNITTNSTSNYTVYEEIKCFGLRRNDSNVCSGHGSCISKDSCQCTQFYEGVNCENKKISCFGYFQSSALVCSGNGQCVSTDTCQCKSNYFGSNCFLSISSSPRFNNLGNTLEFYFNTSHAILNSVLNCSKVIHENSLYSVGQNPYCYSKDGNFFIELGSDYTLTPNSNISLNVDSLDSVLVGTNTKYYVPMMVNPSLNPVKPIISVSYKNVISPCENIIIDASGSSCGDMKPIKYIWSLESSPDALFNLQKVSFNNLNSTLITNISTPGLYVFGLIGESSFSGAKSEKKLIEVMKNLVPNPSISLLTNKMSLINIEQSSLPIIVKKSLELPSCYFDNKEFKFIWKQISGPSVEYQIDSNNDCVITKMKSDETFSFSVSAISSFNPNSNSSLLISLSSISRQLSLNIYVSNLNTNQAEISVEYSDPDNVDVNEIRSWSCFDRVSNQACQDSIISNILTQCSSSSICIIQKSTLSKVSITLTITKGTRTVSKTIDIDFPKSELMIPPVISMISVSPNRVKVLRDELLSLQLSVILGGDEKNTNEENMIREWSINGMSLTSSMTSKMSIDPSKSSSLILSLTDLLEGAEYEIEFKVSDRRNYLSSSFFYKFNVVKSPKSCTCYITPSDGYALETQFSFSCPGCQNAEKSIDFVFGFIDDKSGLKLPLYNLGEKFLSYLPSPVVGNYLNTFVDIVDISTGASVEFIKPVEVKTPIATTISQIRKKVKTWQSYASSLLPSDSAKLVFNSATISRTSELMISRLSRRDATDDEILYEMRDEIVDSIIKGLNDRNHLELISNLHFAVYNFGLESLVSGSATINSLPFEKMFNLTERLLVKATQNGQFRVASGVEKLCASIFDHCVRLLAGSGQLKIYYHRLINSMKMFNNLVLRSFYVGQKDYSSSHSRSSTISLLRYRNQLGKQTISLNGNNAVYIDSIDSSISGRIVLESSLFSIDGFEEVSNLLKQLSTIEIFKLSNEVEMQSNVTYNLLTSIVSLDRNYNSDVSFIFNIDKHIDNTTILECLPIDNLFLSSNQSCTIEVSSPLIRCVCPKSVTSLIVLEKTISNTTNPILEETIHIIHSNWALYGLFGLFGLCTIAGCIILVIIVVSLLCKRKKSRDPTKDVELLSV